MHKLNPTVFGRAKGDRGSNRIAIHIPLEYRLHPVTGKERRKYLYFKAKAGDTISPEFLTFFTNYIHTATDNLSDGELREWIYDD